MGTGTDRPQAGEGYDEEGIAPWQAESPHAAIALAEADTEEHAENLEYEYTGLARSCLGDAGPGHGTEVLSPIRRSRLKPAAHLDGFFDTGDESESDRAEEAGAEQQPTGPAPHTRPSPAGGPGVATTAVSPRQ